MSGPKISAFMGINVSVIMYKERIYINNGNPGRLLTLALFFCESNVRICYHKVSTAHLPVPLQPISEGVGSFHASTSDNFLLGPDSLSLWTLGGLNVDRIRNNGEAFRIFWAMWMHSGWVHLIMNVL